MAASPALEAAGVECVVGVLEADARRLMAPYLKLVETGRPWLIAKWAMSLDGKIATRTGDSQWISGEASRARVHELRGRVDAVLVGAGTLLADDPLLTARPAGPRTPTRIVLADERPLPLDRELWATADEGPVVVAFDGDPPATAVAHLESRGVEVLHNNAAGLLDELGRRRLTNVLVEGGGKLLGRLFDERLVDEAWVFVAPKVLGGREAPGPVGGVGADLLQNSLAAGAASSETVGDDLLVRARFPGP